MESGLEDRNNWTAPAWARADLLVSMESGLEDRNNWKAERRASRTATSLNGVRPRRPEQSALSASRASAAIAVSMESGLEDRNNLQKRLG